MNLIFDKIKSCNDVIFERFGNELKYEMVLHLATLSILHEHAMANLIDGTSNLISISGENNGTTEGVTPCLNLKFIE
jgi:hypothetical protein